MLLNEVHTNSDDDLSGAAATIAMIMPSVVVSWKMAEALLNHPYASILAMFFTAKENIDPIAIATI